MQFHPLLPRIIAQQRGISRYFIGRPCINSGVSKRIAANGQCTCQKCMEAKRRSRESRNSWSRERVCSSCGKVETVRKDNAAKTCKQCSIKTYAWKRNGENGYEMRKPPVRLAPTEPNCSCEHCGKQMRRSASNIKKHVYCSKDCFLSTRQVQRECKYCGVKFIVGRAVVHGSSNSSGNFCSRPCYEKWLCNTERTKHRGSRWSSISKAVIKKAPFCAWCGTRKGRLHVHHIVPYRLTHDNDNENLIPLCPKCHKKVELITVEAMNNSGATALEIMPVMAAMLRQRQYATYHLLKRLTNEHKREAA